MFLQNDCCDLAPPDRLMHAKMLRFRHGGTLGSQSARKKKNAAFSPWGHTWIAIHTQEDMDLDHDQQTSSCDKNRCVLALRAHLDLTPCAMRHLHATRLLRSHAASTLGSLPARKETCSCEKTVAISQHIDLSPCAQRHVLAKRLLRSRAAR